MKKLAALAALPLALTACSSGSGDAASSSSSSSSAAASSASPAASQAARKLGQTLDTGSITITPSEILEVDRSNTHEVIGTGNKLAALRNKSCLKEPTILGVQRWKLIDTDGGEYGATSFSAPIDGFPTPMYPQDAEDAPNRAAGECVAGWIYFEVNAKASIKYVQYTSGSDTSHLVNNRWTTAK